MQATFRVRAMDRFLNLAKLPPADLDATGPKGFQALLLGPGRTEQVHYFRSAQYLSEAGQFAKYNTVICLPAHGSSC